MTAARRSTRPSLHRPSRPGPHRRRRLLLLSAPFVLLALLVAATLLFTSWSAARGADDYRAGRAAAARDQFARLGVINAYQRWIAPFDLGDALYAEQRYADARSRFRVALRLAPADRQCTVRANLALAGERVGDRAVQAHDLSAARSAYALALGDATGGGCTSLAARRSELRRKLAAVDQGRPPPSSTPSSGGSSGTPGSRPPTDPLSARNASAASSQAQASQANGPTPTANPNGRNW